MTAREAFFIQGEFLDTTQGIECYITMFYKILMYS